jgi:hypothetical protein
MLRGLLEKSKPSLERARSRSDGDWFQDYAKALR